MTTAIAFVPDPALPWLYHDQDAQTRDAFTDTKVVTLNSDFTEMGPGFSGGPRLLLKRIYSPVDVEEGAVYFYDQQNVPGYEGHPWHNRDLMGRIAKVEQSKRGSSHSAHLYFRFDNPKEGARRFGASSSGLHYEFVRFSEFAASKSQTEKFGEDWVQRQQAHRQELWKVACYVAPPAADSVANWQYAAQMGMSPRQQQWLDEEEQIRNGKASMVTVRSSGIDYAPTLEQQLGMERTDLVDRLLQDIPAISPGRAHRSKAAIVALTRRNYKRTITEFYSQEAVHAVLNLLDAMCREQAAMATLRNQTAGVGRPELPRQAQLTTTATPVRV